MDGILDDILPVTVSSVKVITIHSFFFSNYCTRNKMHHVIGDCGITFESKNNIFF